MGFKCSFTGFSPGIPREDIWRLPEGGRSRAEEVMADLFNGSYTYSRLGSAGETYPPDDGVWIGTWGDTILLSAEPEFLEEQEWEMSDSIGRWDLNVHSVVDLCHFAVTGGPFGDREVALYADMETTFEEACTGRPLPFEEPFLAGEHDEPLDEDGDYAPPVPFHPLSLGDAAVLWMFGIPGESPLSDAVVDPLLDQWRHDQEIPMHHFQPAPPPERRKRWFGWLGSRSRPQAH